jgi:hypothetical protein
MVVTTVISMVISMVIAPVFFPSGSIVKLIVSNRFLAVHREHAHVYGCALAVQKFAFLILLISRNNSQRFVARYRRISAHGLVVYPHSSIDAAAPNQISDQIGDICLAIPPAVLRPHDLPDTWAFILSGNLHAQQTGKHHDHRQY